MFPLQDTIQARSLPVINWLLILINCLCFFYELSLGDNRLDAFIGVHGLVPAHLTSEGLTPYVISTVFSSMFLHSGWGHLLGNMWFLHIFGDNVEDRMGHLKYLVFYLLCGICAAAAQTFTSTTSTIPMVGASGAISGVLGAYLIYFPHARVIAAVPVFYIVRMMEVPAVIFLGLWFVMQSFSGFASIVGPHDADVGGVAFFAHIGGFVAGMVLCKLFESPADQREWYPDEYRPW